MCFICLQLDKDFPFPTPKELARNINEVLPTEDHLEEIKNKISAKVIKPNEEFTVFFTGAIESKSGDKYLNELDQELAYDLFKHEQHDLKES